MTPSRRILPVLVTLLASLTTVGLAAPPAHAATTTLTLKVAGCNGCTITPIRVLSYSSSDYWSGTPKVVRDGKVTWSIASGRTHGLYFQVDDPSSVATGGVTYAVARYRGKQPGDYVSPSYAASHDRGWHCWYGTQRAAKTLYLRVDRFPGEDPYSHETGYWIRPYFSRTLKTFGDQQQLRHGTFGGQDIKACSS